MIHYNGLNVPSVYSTYPIIVDVNKSLYNSVNVVLFSSHLTVIGQFFTAYDIRLLESYFLLRLCCHKTVKIYRKTMLEVDFRSRTERKLINRI